METLNQQSANPWDDGLGPNVQRFFTFQYRAILHLIISILWTFIWGLKKIQNLIQK
jgi:hypothetical protein